MRLILSLALLLAGTAFAQTGEIAATVVDDQGRPIEDAVVVAAPVDGGVRAPGHPREAIVDQVDREFTPKVTAVVVGTPVLFPNHDNIRHQVYSFSPAKRFELPLYAGVPAEPIVFDKPGVVVLGCNIHDWMIGYIYVSESPHFAKTGKDGKALIGDLPLRAYSVRVWHPQLAAGEETTRKTVAVERTGPVPVDWRLALRREPRVRRAPTVDGRGSSY
jgi:plastocyanin